MNLNKMINKIKTILLMIIGIFTAIIFYGKKKKEEGKREVEFEMMEEEIEFERKFAKQNKLISEMSEEELDKLL